MSDIAGAPIHVSVRRGDLVLAGADIVSVQMDHLQSINPPSGMVGWYGPPQWSTIPGNLSHHPGILAGHSTYSGVADVFYRLGEVKAGDIVTVTYGSRGQVTAVAEFVVDADALSVPKNDVVEQADSTYQWVWQLGEPGRKISIFTCDPAQGRSLAGESLNNWVIQATRIN